MSINIRIYKFNIEYYTNIIKKIKKKTLRYVPQDTPGMQLSLLPLVVSNIILYQSSPVDILNKVKKEYKKLSNPT